ncbi:EDD domain protein, DegV family [Carnobacterium iners]|uniref:EDD domain protein, DegV family n=1 Tax=Carnobacterium iners TaxID=1073423 RepID=A0A1X7MSH5_9LACT|nr:DegV family protein [Carnobacterium iners]SEL25357.1 EDD domain protein, DegV family [Carnobacterium iners]SMH26903.1 EDD domain protein, DegV family [Carnobacterium iners]
MKIAIVTDSTSYLTEKQYEQNSIYMLPLSVIMDNTAYLEEIEIGNEEFFEKITDMEALPTSSQPTTGQIITLFNELAKEYDVIISIHLSSGISGTYANIVSVGDMMKTITVYPFDSELSCAAQGYYVLEAARLAKNGYTVEEIFQVLSNMRKTIKAYFLVDDLNHLVRGGRLSNGSAVIGSLLKIKPILFFENKQIVVFEKIRTTKKALKRIEHLLAEDLSKGYPIVATIIQCNAKEQAANWEEQLREDYPTVRFETSYFGPVIGTHLGKGALGMTWVEDQTKIETILSKQ